MENTAQAKAQTTVTPDQIVAQLLHQTTRDQVKALVESALANSGQAVGRDSFEPGDSICPTFKFPFPFPPKFGDFLSRAALLGPIHVTPLGTPNPIEIIVQTRPGRIA